MTKRELFENVLAGRQTARVPRAAWRHFPHDEYHPQDFVRATVQFYTRHDLDLVKIGPRSSFCIRDYGARDEFEGDYLGRPRYLNQVVQSPDDWRKLRPLDPSKGWLAHTAGCVREICARTAADRPRILTIFSPATQAKNLAGAARLTEHWRTHPAELRAGLETLTESTVAFLRSLRDVPLDGMFFAIQECGLQDLAPGYLAMCGDLDRAILTAGNYWLNVLHLHGKVLGFEGYARYPVSVLHWDEGEAGASLAQVRQHFGGIVSGGVDWPANGWSDPAALKRAARNVVERTGAERLMVSAGCVIPWQTPAEHVDAFCAFDR